MTPEIVKAMHAAIDKLAKQTARLYMPISAKHEVRTVTLRKYGQGNKAKIYATTQVSMAFCADEEIFSKESESA